MTTGSPYNLDAMREVLGKGDADGVLLGAVEGMLPDAPNLTRVRFSGGTENEVGEFPDAVAATFALKAIVSAVEAETRHTVLGELVVGDLIASWLHDDTEGQVLVKGDRVLWRGVGYDVERVTIPEMNAVADFYSAVLRRQTD